jgi:hypothetical protein
MSDAENTIIKKTPSFTFLMRALYVLSFLAVLAILIKGWDFYSAPSLARSQLPNYRLWRSAGFIGHGMGMVGSLFMLLMLLYSLRKRFRFLQGAGSLNNWLQIHIYFGVIGPILIVLHSTFRVQGLVAVSFWSMVAVAVSGVIGRYLFLQIPRNFSGEELNYQQAKELDLNFRTTLKQQYGLDQEVQQQILKAVFPHVRSGSSSLTVILYQLLQDLRHPVRMKNLAKTIGHHLPTDNKQVQELSRLIKEHTILQRRIVLWNHTHSLFHYWHVIHRPFAYIMYVIMMVHVFIAFWLGYRWLF